MDLWLEVQLDGRAFLHYWRNEPEKAAAVLNAARPVVESRGTPRRRLSFYLHLGTQRMRANRYRIDEETLANLQSAAKVAHELGDERSAALPVFVLGFAQLWYGDLDGAQKHIEAALEIVERTGDIVLRTRCLCYLAVTALRRHDADAVHSLAAQTLAQAEAASYPEYVAAAKACQAWAAWRR